MSGYPESLIYFMWEWQVHFMISCKVSAESLFKAIDDQLQATTFLIGFRIAENDNRQAICYEPEKMDFLKDDLSRLESEVTYFDKTDPLRNMHYTGGMQQEMNERRYGKNIREALKKVLDDSASFKDKIHFIAREVTRDGYKVYIILQLKKSIYSNYCFLSYRDPEERLQRHLSFIDSVVYTYLEDRTYRLVLPSAGKDNGADRGSDELLRSAATRFLFTVGYVGYSGRFHAIAPACDVLSLYKYEGRENVGHLIVCRKDHPALDITLELDTPFPFNEYRKIRKLLELTSEDIGVVTNGEFVLGLGKRMANYDTGKEDLFDVYFRGIHCYDVMHAGQPLLLMRHGNPEQVRQLINYTKFSEDARRMFKNITDEQINNLYHLSLAVAQSGKGCMLAFIGDAAAEAKRLKNQCISIKPKKLNKETVEVLISIDGALLIDLDGYAHAKGVILDGIVGIEGDASRGSRYNSALTYYEYRSWEKPTMILVVSEDGMVDVIPKLMPSIRHSEIIQFIKTLESLNSVESFNDRTYYNTMDLLENRAFYLTLEECERINALQASLKNFDEHSGKTMWRTFDDFTPNPRMGSKYYIPET